MPDLILSPIASKTCTKCGVSKLLAQFSKRTKSQDGFDQYCKQCKSEARKLLWRSNSKHRQQSLEVSRVWREANRPAYLKLQKDYYDDNQERLREYARLKYAANTDALLEKNRQYYQANKVQILVWHSEHRKANREVCNARSQAWSERQAEIDPIFRLKLNMRALISLKIRQMGYTKHSTTNQILGCDWEFFKSHIERQFSKGMTWKNRSAWHIDHIRPMAHAANEDDVLALNHFTNLQPMWAKDNLAKGAQITHLI